MTPIRQNVLIPLALRRDRGPMTLSEIREIGVIRVIREIGVPREIRVQFSSVTSSQDCFWHPPES